MLSKPQIWSFLEAHATSLMVLGTPRQPLGLPQTRRNPPNSSTIDFLAITFQTAFEMRKKSDFISQVPKSHWLRSVGTESSAALHLIFVEWIGLNGSFGDASSTVNQPTFAWTIWDIWVFAKFLLSKISSSPNWDLESKIPHMAIFWCSWSTEIREDFALESTVSEMKITKPV